MEVNIITLPMFHIVGYKLEATIAEFEAGVGKQSYRTLMKRKEEIQYRKSERVILMQIYPMNADFNPQVDKFINIIGYEADTLSTVPSDMISHTVPENKYAAYTHQGPESELTSSYNYLYSQWMSETGNAPKDYDFEIWDERYKPESFTNEIDLFIAIQ
ncbi:GyrI-like domain-containing protein [Paenibacillus luteus]|uniref:GyrI-like domain-containing protein n=1 Tax=Paenibacillus luteus TaxID=2545753 RepID=UPI0011423FC8|nr:GyrI-like domain-containing protein [Paenibacillus luteus]